jgi:hypothetical protein
MSPAGITGKHDRRLGESVRGVGDNMCQHLPKCPDDKRRTAMLRESWRANPDQEMRLLCWQHRSEARPGIFPAGSNAQPWTRWNAV